MKVYVVTAEINMDEFHEDHIAGLIGVFDDLSVAARARDHYEQSVKDFAKLVLGPDASDKSVKTKADMLASCKMTSLELNEEYSVSVEPEYTLQRALKPVFVV